MSGKKISALDPLVLPQAFGDTKIIGRGTKSYRADVLTPLPIPTLIGLSQSDSAPRGIISDDPTVWWDHVNMPLYINGSQSNWADVVYAPALKQLFAVAALNGGSNRNVIAASRDGRTYAGRWDDTNTVNNGIAWSPSLGMLCICASAGLSTTDRIITSTDGLIWTRRNLPTASISLTCIAWSPTLNLFCAMGSSNAVYTSPDGITWTQRTGPVSGGSWRRVLWAGGTHNKFYALDGNNVARSSDGITWAMTFVFSGNGRGLVFSDTLNTLVFTDANTNNFISHSTNGTTWNNHTVAGFWQDVAWSPRLGLFIAVGAKNMATSPDGVTWTLYTSSPIAGEFTFARLIATQ
jgi:hypothetical protein